MVGGLAAAAGALAGLAAAGVGVAATGAAAATGAVYAGVDIIRDASGELQVLEVNSNPAWAALQRVSAINIAQALADHLLAGVARPAATVDA